MQQLTFNNKNIVLSNTLEEFELIQNKVGYVIFNEICLHLKIPVLNLSSSELNGEKVLLEEQVQDLLRLDDFLYAVLDFKDFARPNLMLRYGFLLQYFGLEFDPAAIGVIPTKRKQLIAFNREIDVGLIEVSRQNEFVKQMTFILTKGIFQTELETFEVLMDESLKQKLSLALAKYQFYFEESINKTELINRLINKDRLNQLIDFQ